MKITVRREYVSALLQIQNEIERLSNVIDILLSITRLGSSEICSLFCDALIWEVLETMVLAKEKNIEIETDLQENLGIAGDQKHLSGYVPSLLDNAIKYATNGKIKLRQNLVNLKEDRDNR